MYHFLLFIRSYNYKIIKIYRDLSSNKILKLEANTFEGLTNLNELDLEYNEITMIPKNAFTGLTKLNHQL